MKSVWEVETTIKFKEGYILIYFKVAWIFGWRTSNLRKIKENGTDLLKQ